MGTLPIAQAAGQHGRQLRANGRAERTVDPYLRALDQLARFTGDRDVDQVTPDDIARFILRVQHRADGTPKAAITVNQTRRQPDWMNETAWKQSKHTNT